MHRIGNGRRDATPQRAAGKPAARCAGLAAAAALAVAGPAGAFELPGSGSGFTGFLDTTVSVGASMRASHRDADLVGIGNGGKAESLNGDNGNLNYDKGDVFSAAGKVTHELSMDWGEIDLFARGLYFWDHAVVNRGTERTRLSDTAKRHAGRDFRLLDAYVNGDFDVGDTPVSVRAGNQVINWGESVFIRNGLSSINPIDVTSFRVAGAEVRDALEPIPAVNVRVGVTENLSIESFYQFGWQHTEIEPSGTYFSTNDYISPGGDRLCLNADNPAMLGPGDPRILPTGILDPPRGPCPPTLAPYLGHQVSRAADRDADHQGQFGAAVRYFSPELNDTEFGFYYARIHSRLPLVSGVAGDEVTGVPAIPDPPTLDPTIVPNLVVSEEAYNALTPEEQAVADAARRALMAVLQDFNRDVLLPGNGFANRTDYAASARYFREFPEDIDMFGASFNTEIGSTGIALQGEVSYRRDQPLQVDDAAVLGAAVAPLAETIGEFADSLEAYTAPLAPLNDILEVPPGFVSGRNRAVANGLALLADGGLEGVEYGQEVTGFRRKDVVQMQGAMTKVLGPSLGADQLALFGEAGFTMVRNMESKSELRYEGPGTDLSGDPRQAAHQEKGFADPFSWGYRVLARATYDNAVGAVGLSPQVAFAHDVTGTTPAPLGNYVEGRKAVTLSLGANYLNSIEADLSYTNYFGGGSFNLLKDRDFVSFTVRHSF